MTGPEGHCRVCGLLQKDPPWGQDDKTPDFEICDCCGTEFGYEDATPAGVVRKRKAWLTDPGAWFRPEAKPAGWDTSEQLLQVPEAFRNLPDG